MKFGFSHNKNRKAAVSGQFYPGNSIDLKDRLNELFEKAEASSTNFRKQADGVQALISPHAGYMFSGEVAASAFLQIPKNKRYKRIFVLASSHRYFFDGASVYCNGNYETPLGEIKVDCTLGEKLVSGSTVFLNKPEAHEEEHSLEVQLPFLQHRLQKDFVLVPIIIGNNDEHTCKKIAEGLKPYLNAENLFVISTDFSHFPAYDDALAVDKNTAEVICSNNPEQLLATIEENKKKNIENLATSLCGWTSVLTFMYITQDKDFKYKKIQYRNSGDTKAYGEKNRVVGYWSMAVYRSSAGFEISDNEKVAILKKARKAIEKFLDSGEKTVDTESEISGILQQQAGVFVSAYIKGELRGCIGNFAGDKTLNELVQKMAVSSVCDRRFENVEKDELKHMELEISVLSPLKKINSKDEIELGRHGIYIKENYSSGTFLPQVATKTGWNVDQFLGHCSRDKAGLGWDGWKSAEVFTYEAIIFRG